MNIRIAPCVLLFFSLLVHVLSAAGQTPLPAKFALPSNPIELQRAARPAMYFDAVGRKAALFGRESGAFEAWVFPMKLLYDARLSVKVEGRDDPIELASLVERVIARPESTTLIAVHELFNIRATFFSPIDEPGSIVLLDVDTVRPLTIIVQFRPDLKPMWPGGLGGQRAAWRDDLKAFVLGESRGKINGLFGSPAAQRGVATPAHHLAARALRFELDVDPKIARQNYYPLLLAGSLDGVESAIERYRRLAASIPEQYRKTANHYRRLREELLTVESPDKTLNLAVEWAKVALDKGMVENPELGLGLVAGWGAAGDGARPGFGWFFGGDASINSYAMTGAGEFDSMRAAFRFLAKYQRADGKIPHEVSQSAATIEWFKEYRYAYSHAETTPFFIAAVYNFYRQSGDRPFIEELWPALRKAYEFCLANDSDGDGILENTTAGLGASELGSLREDTHQDIYLAATNLEASLAMRELAAVMNDSALRELADQKQQRANVSIKELYWDQPSGRYAYALSNSGKLNTEVTAWTAAPLMFGQLDPTRVSETVATLSSARISTDWGVRMLGDASPAYNPVAYNNGGVWPFLTGMVACAEYEYRRPHSGFAHLTQLARLAFDHALGAQPEILSGEFYRPLDESVPRQLFSSGMTITPLLRGLLGLRPDAPTRSLRLAPQLPAAWDSLRITNYRIGPSKLAFTFTRVGVAAWRYELSKEDDAPLKIQFAPALPALARAGKVLVDGRAVKLNPCLMRGADTTCNLELQLRRRVTVDIALKSGIEIDAPQAAPEPGARTSALKVLEVTTPGPNRLGIRVEGLAGGSYVLRARGPSAVQDVLRGAVKGEDAGWKLIEVVIPPADDNRVYLRRDLELRLREGRR
jgi:glycogen debranching enzyme